MLSSMKIIPFLLALPILTNIGFCLPQISRVSEVKYFYEELQFEKAVQVGQAILHQEQTFKPEELQLIHHYMAFSFFNTGKTDSARAHFLTLLSINPDYRLDAVSTSPKILDFFDKIKGAYKNIGANTSPLAYTHYIFIDDLRPAAAWRSAVLPGWGQYYKRQPLRSYLLGGAYLGSILITFMAFFKEADYKRQYSDSRDRQKISDLYEHYNNWSKARRISTIAAVSVWGIAVADAVFSPYPKLELTRSQDDARFLLSCQLPF